MRSVIQVSHKLVLVTRSPVRLKMLLFQTNSYCGKSADGSSILSNPFHNEFAEQNSSSESNVDENDSNLGLERENALSSKDDHSTETFREEESDSEEERQVGEQGRYLLNMFVNERAQNFVYEPIIGKLCSANAAGADRLGFSDESLNDIADTWRRINDDIQYVFDNFTDQIPLFLSKELYNKVCLQVFDDGEIIWGRVVALFYFAYRLNYRALAKGLDNIPWVQQVLTWTGDFPRRFTSEVRMFFSVKNYEFVNKNKKRYNFETA